MTHSSAKTERLDEAIDALSEIGWAIEVADANWCLRWVSEELKLMLSGGDHAVGVGDTMVGSRLGRGITGFVTDDAVRLWLEHHVPYIMWDTGANADALMEGVDERWRP